MDIMDADSVDNDTLPSSVSDAVNNLKVDKFITHAIKEARKPNADLGVVVGNVVRGLLPQVLQIASTVADEVINNVKPSLEHIDNRIDAWVGKIKNETQKQEWKLDAIEQYTRRDSIKIFGVEEKEGEDTNELVVNVAKSIGVNISTSDISVSHRMPSKTGKKPIIAKFTRRDTKTAIMKCKKKLKSINERSNKRPVYINEDLSSMRAKLLRSVKSDPKVKGATSIELFVIWMTHLHQAKIRKLL